MFGWLGKKMGERIGRRAGEEVAAQAIASIKAGKFDHLIADAIVKATREWRDHDLSRTVFIRKIAVELIDKSNPKLTYQKALPIALEVYAQFRRDNEGVKFGTPGWDWDGAAARILAREYEIEYWEPSNG